MIYKDGTKMFSSFFPTSVNISVVKVFRFLSSIIFNFLLIWCNKDIIRWVEQSDNIFIPIEKVLIQVELLKASTYLTAAKLPYLWILFAPKHERSSQSEECTTVQSELHTEGSGTDVTFCWCRGSKDIPRKISLKQK